MGKIKNFILLLPFIGLCCWALYYIHFVKSAAEVVLPITGYDPRNLLSGHYIEFQIDWSKANCNQADWNNVCPKNDFKGVNRFYVAENKAKELERSINNNFVTTEIVFAYIAGARPVAKELLIDGQPWHQHKSDVYPKRKEVLPNNQHQETAAQELTRQELDANCMKYCGDGYFYDRKGAKNGGNELVCTRYPLECRYDCTLGWKFRYLVDGTNYTCQEAQQDPSYSRSRRY